MLLRVGLVMALAAGCAATDGTFAEQSAEATGTGACAAGRCDRTDHGSIADGSACQGVTTYEVTFPANDGGNERTVYGVRNRWTRPHVRDRDGHPIFFFARGSGIDEDGERNDDPFTGVLCFGWQKTAGDVIEPVVERGLWHVFSPNDWAFGLLHVVSDRWIQGIRAATNQDGRVEVFADTVELFHIPLVTSPSGILGKGPIFDNAELRHLYELDGSGSGPGAWSWSDLGSLGDPISDSYEEFGYTPNFEVAANADGRLEVFYFASDGYLTHRWQDVPNAGWGAPARLGDIAIKPSSSAYATDAAHQVRNAHNLLTARLQGSYLRVSWKGTHGRDCAIEQVAGGWSDVSCD